MTKMKAVWITGLLAISFCIVPAVSPRLYSQENKTVAAPGALVDDSLRKMLDGMGYEPKALSKGFLIAIKRDTWTINIQVVISPNGEKIGINSNLGIVENPDAVTAAQWKSLLAANADIDPSAFYFDATQKKLYLHRSLDNRGITPAILRQQVENFCGNMVDTSALWSFTK